jgi:hypothetical protein
MGEKEGGRKTKLHIKPPGLQTGFEKYQLLNKKQQIPKNLGVKGPSINHHQYAYRKDILIRQFH